MKNWFTILGLETFRTSWVLVFFNPLSIQLINFVVVKSQIYFHLYWNIYYIIKFSCFWLYCLFHLISCFFFLLNRGSLFSCKIYEWIDFIFPIILIFYKFYNFLFFACWFCIYIVFLLVIFILFVYRKKSYSFINTSYTTCLFFFVSSLKRAAKIVMFSWIIQDFYQFTWNITTRIIKKQ